MPETSEKPKRRSARPPETGWDLGAGGLGKVAWSVLAVLLVEADDVVVTSRQRLYADPVVADLQSAYQQIVLTERFITFTQPRGRPSLERV